MASRATKKLKMLEVIEQEPLREEIAAITRQLPHLRGWSYLPERLAVLKAQLDGEKNTAAKARGNVTR